MNSYFTIPLLIAAGAALVIQNLLMVRITEQASTVLIALLINSSVGLLLLLTFLLLRNGVDGMVEIGKVVQPWVILPGLLGSFFVFAGIIGFQKVGAATTIAVLVSSQLITGLFVDSLKSDIPYTRPESLTFLGAALLVLGAILVVRGRG